MTLTRAEVNELRSLRKTDGLLAMQKRLLEMLSGQKTPAQAPSSP